MKVTILTFKIILYVVSESYNNGIENFVLYVVNESNNIYIENYSVCG